MEEAVDKVMRPYHKIIACQTGDVGSILSNLPPHNEGDLPKGSIEYLPTTDRAKPMTSDTNDANLLDFDALAAWTFDDWNFTANDFAAFGDAYPPLDP